MAVSGNAGKILIFSGVRGDTRRYRTLHLYEQLRLAGADCVVSHLMDPALPGLIASAAVVIVHRVAMDDYVRKLFIAMRQRNAFVVLDTDDYLYDPTVMRWIDSPDFQDPVRARLYQRELLRQRELLEACDAVTVSTPYLAGMVSAAGKPVRVHRNAFSQEMLCLSEQAFRGSAHPSGKVVIGYASGTRTHDKDFAMIRPALCNVLERYPLAELWLMGAVDPGQGFGKLQSQVRVFPFAPWRDLPRRLAAIDINLAPLVAGNPFNESKSEIKVMEAALVRAPSIASRMSAFEDAIRSGETGILADGLSSWRDGLDFLVRDTGARQAMGIAAYQDVLSRYAPRERGLAMLETLSELAAEAGKTMPEIHRTSPALEPPYLFTYQDELRPTVADMARYSIRNRGVATLAGQVWIYFRRLIAPIFPFRERK